MVPPTLPFRVRQICPSIKTPGHINFDDTTSEDADGMDVEIKISKGFPGENYDSAILDRQF